MGTLSGTLSIVDGKEEIKIYFGKSVDTYIKNLKTIAKRYDIKSYKDKAISNTMKFCIIEIIKVSEKAQNIEPYYSIKAEKDIKSGINHLIALDDLIFFKIFGKIERSTSSIVRKCVDKIYDIYIKSNEKHEEMTLNLIITDLLNELKLEPTHERIIRVRNWQKKNNDHIQFRKYIEFRNLEPNFDITIVIRLALFLKQLCFRRHKIDKDLS